MKLIDWIMALACVLGIVSGFIAWADKLPSSPGEFMWPLCAAVLYAAYRAESRW